MATQAATPISAIQKRQPNSQVILKRKLFGPPPKEKKPVKIEQAAPVQLTVTSLDLTLLGTITGSPNNRRAIILDKKKKLQDIYYQGDTVQGAAIKEIQRGKIILTVNGKDEILVPETPKTNAATASAPVFPSPVQPEPIVQDAPADNSAASVVEPEPIEPPPAPSIEQPEPAEPAANNPAEPNEPEANKPSPDQNPKNVLPPNTNNNQDKP